MTLNYIFGDNSDDFEYEPDTSFIKEAVLEALLDEFCPLKANREHVKTAFNNLLSELEIIDDIFESFRDVLTDKFEDEARESYEEQQQAAEGQRGIERDYERMRG